MRDPYYICFSSLDLDQVLDGLDICRRACLDKARYLRIREVPHERFLHEEGSNAQEAEQIVEYCSRIVDSIRRQRVVQDGTERTVYELPTTHADGNRPGFCIYVDTLIQGPVPVERNDTGNPVVYASELEAQREIADITLGRLYEFLAGEREFDDATTVSEYVVPVDVMPDGSILDEAGNHFGRKKD